MKRTSQWSHEKNRLLSDFSLVTVIMVFRFKVAQVAQLFFLEDLEYFLLVFDTQEILIRRNPRNELAIGLVRMYL